MVVDRLLSSIRRVERLEAELELQSDPAKQEPLLRQLEPALRARTACLAALASAADCGDPEAQVVLDELYREAATG